MFLKMLTKPSKFEASFTYQIFLINLLFKTT